MGKQIVRFFIPDAIFKSCYEGVLQLAYATKIWVSNRAPYGEYATHCVMFRADYKFLFFQEKMNEWTFQII